MHTLAKNGKTKKIGKRKGSGESASEPLYNVVFHTRESMGFVVDTNLPKAEAMKLVNYLNGGIGHPYGSTPEVSAECFDAGKL